MSKKSVRELQFIQIVKDGDELKVSINREVVDVLRVHLLELAGEEIFNTLNSCSMSNVEMQAVLLCAANYVAEASGDTRKAILAMMEGLSQHDSVVNHDNRKCGAPECDGSCDMESIHD